ncbi:MAG: hypothetical protein ACI39R_08750 [Lachnospiraceae bacterium]
MQNKKIGKWILIGALIFFAVLVLLYLILILRLEIKYSAKVNYDWHTGVCMEQKGEYSVLVHPWFAYENYALIEKTVYDEKYDCNATVSVIVKETIFGYRTMLFSVHTETLHGSVSGQFDENMNFTESGSSVIPLSEEQLNRIDECHTDIYDVMREADELWELGLNIPED